VGTRHGPRPTAHGPRQGFSTREPQRSTPSVAPMRSQAILVAERQPPVVTSDPNAAPDYFATSLPELLLFDRIITI
jgi:hypothetical protein